MSPRALLAAWLLSVVVLGGLVLELRARDAAELAALSRAVSEVRSAPLPQAAAARSAGQGIDAAMMDAIAARVASRLHRDDGAVHDAVTPTAAPAETWTADQHAARDRAAQLVDRVLEGRRLTRTDIHELRRELAAVDDPDATTEVYRRLIVALNTHALVADEPDLLAAP